jgi:hypothetical protein
VCLVYKGLVGLDSISFEHNGHFCERCFMDLRDTTFVHVERFADLFHAHVLRVIHRHNILMHMRSGCVSEPPADSGMGRSLSSPAKYEEETGAPLYNSVIAWRQVIKRNTIEGTFGNRAN